MHSNTSPAFDADALSQLSQRVELALASLPAEPAELSPVKGWLRQMVPPRKPAGVAARVVDLTYAQDTARMAKAQLLACAGQGLLSSPLLEKNSADSSQVPARPADSSAVE